MTVETGPVGFIDILGFSRRARAEDLPALLDAYERALDVTRDGGTLQYVVSSDSIVVTLERATADETGLLLLAWGCSRLYYELSRMHVPVRGSVAFGRYIRRRTNHGEIVAGAPIVEAYEYERRLATLGLILAPSTVQHYDRLATTGYLSEPTPEHRRDLHIDAVVGPMVAQRTRVPFQTTDGRAEGFLEAYAILPTSRPALGRPDYSQARADYREVSAALSRMSAYAPDPRSQSKYASARTILALAEQRGVRAFQANAWSNLTESVE